MAQSKRKDLSVAEKLKVIDALTQKKTQMEVAKEFGISILLFKYIQPNWDFGIIFLYPEYSFKCYAIKWGPLYLLLPIMND